jgi:hypothetical protein
MPMMTTLNEIKKFCSPENEWEQLLLEKLLKGLGKTEADDDPVLFSYILKNNSIAEALWCLRLLPDEYDNMIRLFNVKIARRVQHLLEDERAINALDVAEKYANGEATKDDLKIAWEQACDAAKFVAETRGKLDWETNCFTYYAICGAAYETARESAISTAFHAAQILKKEEIDWQKEQFLKLVNGD